MSELRNDFDELGEKFSSSYEKDFILDWSVLPEEDLKKLLKEYIQYISSFTIFYNAFDKKILERIDVISFQAYKDRALANISVCQNQFIIPITNEITRRDNEQLQIKADDSIKQGQSLLIKANKSSFFAKITFVIALTLSIGSIVISKISSTNSESVLNQNTVTIENIMVELDSIKASNLLNKEISNGRNIIIQQKLDTILKKK